MCINRLDFLRDLWYHNKKTGGNLVMKTIIPDFTYTPDPHAVIENADFAPLDKLYAGRKVYYGDYHAHAATGGTSDGKTTLADWRKAMDELKIDFAGIMDHRQVRHMYLDDFDPEYFIYGTEPAAGVDEPKSSPHYLMLFGERDTLENKILNVFPEYQFTGGIEGHFIYNKHTYERFTEIVQAVVDAGGAFVHPHPKQVMKSDDPDDYLFVEGTAIETIYAEATDEPLCANTIANYKLWRDLLMMGRKVYNTATSDCHRAPKYDGINAIYAENKHCSDYVKQLRNGDVTAGFFGIKMGIGNSAMGGEAEYADNLNLLIKVEDHHPLRFKDDEEYRIDVITNRGLAYSAPFTFPMSLALKVEKRKFYRVEIIRESDGSPCAIGNPIWLK